MKTRNFYRIFITLLALLATGCTKEDITECGIVLEILSRPEDLTSRLTVADVESVDVYIFDKDGYFVRAIKETKENAVQGVYQIPILLDEGAYSFVVWGNVDGETHEISPSLVPGKSKLDDLMLIWKTEGDEIDETTGFPKHVYYGTIGDVDVKYEGRQYVDVTLSRNSKDISVLMTGLPFEETEDGPSLYNFSAYIVANNSMFDFRNRVVDNGDKTYIPRSVATGEGLMQEFVYFYESASTDITNSSLIVVYHNPYTGEDEILIQEPLRPDMIKLIEEKYGTGRSLDDVNEYDIVLRFNYSFGTIEIQVLSWEGHTLNGWRPGNPIY
ncbi:MAG: FimB/Mfa2 family fimbrial subunit [Bacteroidales bacterium]|jgi:hypothetical protein|nr:FimB/Mfa2 family fimbrial subunit [Bacteroidales bacterium]